jgi:hypothetical protein
MLASLLDEGEATLEMIESRVFTDVTPVQARGSLHLIKRQVAKAVAGLSIPYDPDSRTYRVVLNWATTVLFSARPSKLLFSVSPTV